MPPGRAAAFPMITIEPPSKTSIPAPRSQRTRTLARVFLLLALTLPTQAQSAWHLVWSDEFNAPNGSAPDSAKWNIVTGGEGFGNNELETYTARPDNIQQRDGNLVITARKQDLTGPDGIPRNYTSARINTQNHFAQKYGRFEARIKLPTGKGVWPAFWILGDDHETNPWPTCGEIDILETIGSPTTMYSTIHGPGYSGRKGPTQKFVLPPGQQVDNAFHLYAVEWSANDIKFFLDDHLIVERTPADLPPDTRWVFDHPFYLVLNLAVGGYWPGNPDQTTNFPQQMVVDYVRVYTRNPEPPANPGGPSFASFAKGGFTSPEGRPLSSPNPTPYTTATTQQAQP